MYQQLKSVILNGFPHTKAELPDVLKPFWNIRHDLVFNDNFIVYDCRLFIPTVLPNRILFDLHDSHQGIARTKERARLAVYWPGIDRDIDTIIGACKQRQDDLPSLGREPMITHALPEHPFQQLAADFAQLDGRNYLKMVDCYTDWPSIQLMNQSPTTNSLTSALHDDFARTAVPDVLWSDDGPQFRSHISLLNFSKDGSWSIKCPLRGTPSSKAKLKPRLSP